MKLIDLTHTFSEHMPVYPGDPFPQFEQTAEISAHGYNEYKLSTGMHVGTHMDAPLHMIANGSFLSEQPVDRFFGRGRLIDGRGRTELEADLLHNQDLGPGDIVILFTGWSKKYRDADYYDGYPEISPGLAQRLVENRVSILGLDTPSPDRQPFQVHKILLGNGVLIIENLCNLESLTSVCEFEVIALPVKLQCEGGPVRVVARVLNQ